MAHDPAKSTAATLTAHLPFQWFMPAVPSGRQKERGYFEIWQPAMRIQCNPGFNIFLRYLAVFAALSDPARPTSFVTAHKLALKASLWYVMDSPLAQIRELAVAIESLLEQATFNPFPFGGCQARAQKAWSKGNRQSHFQAVSDRWSSVKPRGNSKTVTCQ